VIQTLMFASALEGARNWPLRSGWKIDQGARGTFCACGQVYLKTCHLLSASSRWRHGAPLRWS